MAKTFSAEQIRLNGILLTEGTDHSPSSPGDLYFNGVKLAQGEDAADISTTVDAGSGLYGMQDKGLGDNETKETY